MKIWNIENGSSVLQIETSNITTLKSQDIIWYHLIRDIDRFFNTKSTDIKIYEDTQPLNKKDWLCYFIPFDAQVHLDKITSKSPLKDVQNYASEQITYSPFYSELQEIWEQLNDELQLVNQNLKNLGITASLKKFEAKNINNFLTFHSDNEKMTPIQYKQLLLNIALNHKMDKKVLIILELPELYTRTYEFEKYYKIIENAAERGYNFLIVTDQSDVGESINYTYKGTIVNNAIIDQMKSKIIKEVPFFCSEEMYDKAKNIFYKVVDNSITTEEIRVYTGENYGAIVTIINVLLYNLNIGIMHDLTDIEPNLQRFLKGYI